MPVSKGSVESPIRGRHESACRTSLVVGNVRIEKVPYHSLVLGVAPPGLLLEEVHCRLAQSDSNSDPFFAESQLTRGWKEIIDYPDVPQRLICVSYFLFHRCLFPFANNRLQ